MTQEYPLPVGLNTHNKYVIGVALFVLWVSGTVYAFWWFQYRLLQPFTGKDRQTAVVFNSDSLRKELAVITHSLSTADAKATVIHYWDPACPCNRFNEAHVKQLMQHYGREGVRFVIVAVSHLKTAKQIFVDPAVVGFIDGLPERSQPPSSPAVAIMDRRGELAYFGPYSVGAVCSVGKGNFVEKTLDKVLRGVNPRFWNTLAVGCFCPWPTNDTTVSGI